MVSYSSEQQSSERVLLRSEPGDDSSREIQDSLMSRRSWILYESDKFLSEIRARILHIRPERSTVRRNPLPSRRVQNFVVFCKVNPAQQSIYGRVASSRHSDDAVKLILQQLVPLLELRKQGNRLAG